MTLARWVSGPVAPTRALAAQWAVLWVLVVLGVGIALYGGARLLVAPRLPDVGTVPAAHPTVVESSGVATLDSAVQPTWLSLPEQGVEAPVVAVGITPGGELTVPDDPKVLGWWRDGVRPGAPRGTVVIDGHVDTREVGAGALYRLGELKLGSTVSLATTAGTQAYVVRAVHSYPKAQLPKDLFDTTGVPRLVLITCGGSFNFETHQYSDNIVVYAVPAGTA
jgi:hypothetical protein